MKNYEKVTYTPPIEKMRLSDYIREHKENKVGFYYTRIITDYGKRTLMGTTTAGNGDEIKIYRHTDFTFSSISKIAKEEGITEDEAYSKYFDDIFMVTNAQTSILSRVNEYVGRKNELISYEYIPLTGKDKGTLTRKFIWNETLVVWLKDSALLESGIVYKTQKMGTLWSDISWGRLDLEGDVSFKAGKKPERLLERIISMATEPGDLVLDSFLGSGTTAAVAHKLNRRYIGIEMGQQAYTHCKVRLDKVIDGSDKNGVTKMVNWQGGGGYHFCELAPTLITKDSFGEYIINQEYDATMLAAGVALHEGFTYQPDDTFFWKQSVGNENSFLFVTTRHLTAGYLDSIKSTMDEEEYLIIACCSYDAGLDRTYDNITIQKIPQMLLAQCEFGRDDYNLNIVCPPVYDDEGDGEESDE